MTASPKSLQYILGGKTIVEYIKYILIKVRVPIMVYIYLNLFLKKYVMTTTNYIKNIFLYTSSQSSIKKSRK